MTEQKGDPVGLRMGLQAGALIGLYLGFSLATISVLTDAEEIKRQEIKIDNQSIKEILTVNGVRFSFDDGSWGLIRASSNKPSLVIVTESPTSNERMKKIFQFIDQLIQKTGKIGKYDQIIKD